MRRAKGPFRFEATAYYTQFKGFIYRRLTGNTCDDDTSVCGPGAGELNEAIYSQTDAIFRGGEFQSQWDLAPLGNGMFGIEDQFDVVRATFADGTNVPAFRRCASAAAYSGATPTGSRASTFCTPSRRTILPPSPRRRRPATTTCGPNSATTGSRQSPGRTSSAK